MALGALRVLREQGLAVPDDVSVVGYDNIGLSEFAAPALTTVNVPRKRIGHAISSALLPSGAGSRDAARDVLFQPELIIRDSTGPAGELGAGGDYWATSDRPIRSRSSLQ